MSYIGYAICFFFFKQKTAYEMRISDWSSDVCSSDLPVSSSQPPWTICHHQCCLSLNQVDGLSVRTRTSLYSVDALSCTRPAVGGANTRRQEPCSLCLTPESRRPVVGEAVPRQQHGGMAATASDDALQQATMWVPTVPN